MSFYNTGTLQLQFDSSVLVLPGDELAAFNEVANSVTTVPVLVVGRKSQPFSIVKVHLAMNDMAFN